MFATEIENSYPTIRTAVSGRDQMASAGTTTCGAGLRTRRGSWASVSCAMVRHYAQTFLGPAQYDWEFTDLTFSWLRETDIVPIVDLCHFGVPDWMATSRTRTFPALRGVRTGLCASVSVGPALHAGERDVHRAVLGRTAGGTSD